ncbi:MAG: DEAD/DEAH box helicase, partial [Thermoplasmata archaeon]|nr:DEAD/DEAH box helicase [Thermoplasmata archaeon]
VVVSAATGTGKTLIADFVIDKVIGETVKQNLPSNQDSERQAIKEESTKYNGPGPRIVYTAPLKALSNQKYREFTTEYGSEAVGILTGDVQINPRAPLVIMTTEIYRNMLVSNDQALNNIEYTIFDEVHYLSDFERGTVWEESIIFSPDHVKFLCLSATVPNANELAGWIKSIKGQPIDVIEWAERAVPLKYYLFDSKLGICGVSDLRSAIRHEMKLEEELLKDLRRKRKSKRWHKYKKLRKKRGELTPPPSHVALVAELKEKNMLPALLFSFSRRDCQNKARELAGSFNFGNPEGRSMAKKLFAAHVDPELNDLESVQLVKLVLDRGIGVHHAGLLPGLKVTVEKLFALGHLKALYATETFALGVNMPARSVGFLGLRKFDGTRNRNLLSNEFSQCSGRAGRRGIDEIGYVVSLMSRNKSELSEYQTMLSSELEPIISQFTLSYNTVINLVKNHSPAEREVILKSSFDYYIRRKNKKHMWVMRRYNQYLKVLNKLRYLDGEKVTKKGEFASGIYTYELLVSEIFATGLYKRLDNIALAIILTAIMYEERRDDHFKFDRETNYYEQIISVLGRNPVVASEINYMSLKRMCFFVRRWCEG